MPERPGQTPEPSPQPQPQPQPHAPGAVPSDEVPPVAAAPADGPAAPGEAGAVAPGPRPRRRGRTTLLIAAAAVLGVVAGTCAGYLVQADREPTALPSLSQPKIAQAKGEVEPLSAAQDRRVKTEGDLRKLLVKRPKGARDPLGEHGDDSWMSLAGYAENFEKPEVAFERSYEDEFRRAAVVGWREDSSRFVEVRLVQFRQEEAPEALGSADNGHYWAGRKSGADSWPIPGTGDGEVYVDTKPEAEPGYVPMYSAEAHAWRGDVALEIYIYDTKPIPKKKIMDLAKRQMERL
ncbi:hypothetical protein [Streptomyces sp. NPDC002952]|uniref:hypothetical protein n=1 Tax=Streptomyces sp. NPDC002952 TaxID=3364673 RepID=UPI0036BF6B94